jgi:diguanylate cyclase (GGDEF)-like protein/PAS domain S-box-containing protein
VSRSDWKYRALLDRAPVGVFETDASFSCVYVNPRWCELTGLTPEEAYGSGWGRAIRPEDVDPILHAFARALDHGGEFRLEHRYVRPDGSHVWVLAVAEVMRDQHGNVDGLVTMATDITAERIADERLQESEERYRLIVETADEGVWMMDPDDRTTFVNSRMAEMLGYTVDEMLERSLADFLDTSTLAELQVAGERRRRGERDRRTYRARHRDGRDVWIRVSASPINGPSGEYLGSVGLVTDVTREQEMEASLRYNEARLTALFEATSDIMAVLGRDGDWHASPSGTRILGYPMGHEEEGGLLGLIHPDDIPVAAEALHEVISGERRKHERVRLRVRHIDGHYLTMECTAESRLDDPNVDGIVIIARDVTEQQAAEDARAEAEARFRAAFESSPMALAVIDLGGYFIDVNDALCEMVGATEEELVGSVALELVHPEDRLRVEAETMPRVVDGAPGRPVAVRLVHRDGHAVWVLCDSTVVFHGDGSPAYAISFMIDITERKQLEARLEHQAFHDVLTGLPNRARLRDTLDDAWRRRDASLPMAVLFVDLDRFKEVNDRFGHDAGDELLMLVARRLRQAVRGGDRIARFGGDEFVVVCDQVSGRNEATAIAARIRESLSREYLLSAGRASIAACVGVALDEGQGSVEELLRDADIAAYRAKDLGRNRIEIAVPQRAVGA